MMNKPEMYDFLKSKNFKLIEHDASKYFGDYYETFSNDIFKLRFSSSKSIETVDIEYIEKEENWHDLALVKALLYKEENLNKVTTIEEYYEFLIKELDRIGELFGNRNYSITKIKLDELGNKRMKQMLPGRVRNHLL